MDPSLEAAVVSKGILAIKGEKSENYKNAPIEIDKIIEKLGVSFDSDLYPLVVVCDDPKFLAADFNNFLWATFTRSNPSHDIYGIGAKTEFKHWGCSGSLIDDA